MGSLYLETFTVYIAKSWNQSVKKFPPKSIYRLLNLPLFTFLSYLNDTLYIAYIILVISKYSMKGNWVQLFIFTNVLKHISISFVFE